ncbi:zinc finger and SCAN domain-containing protein 31-like [Siniperca chuatsi]|uniref:zinc finger and SCAN domain-containing protein 31-like n=1 Tax=Siniperca chuatsi TaxID=119488 RepID=UPI001CE0EF3A|nr:zinc finger and SCAN domain-containing protein 31-like [Siniperca chuatsi]
MLLSWIRSDNMEAELVDSFNNMSKAEILRGIVTEKLTTAAQEILAVVERTVAGYEEEASGFRQEIHRQRRQLELLLQPRDLQSPQTGDSRSALDCDFPPTSQTKRLQPLKVKTLTPEEIYRSIRSTGHSALYHRPQRNNAAADSPSTPDQTRVQSDRRKPGRPWISKPQDHVDLRIRILEDSHVEVLLASESAEELRSHLQSHQKTHSCKICGKSFLSITGLNGHVARHKGKKPYECKICHKAFAQRSVLRNHKWVHEVDKPHKCDLCQKSCVSKFDLTRHRLTHTGEKLHRCNMCGKSLRSLETLSQHMLSHSDRGRTFAANATKDFYATQTW